MKLARPASGADELALGRIAQLRRVGAQVKLSVELPGGETVTVEKPKSELDALGLKEGDRVLVDVEGSQLFVGDCSI